VAAVSFLFTNPRHHLDMMAPVARELSRRGVECQLLSLAELRGFETPANVDGSPGGGVAIRAVIPFKPRRKPSVGANPGAERAGVAQRVARRAASALLVPWIRRLVGRSRAVVIPNDTAFPYDRLVRSMAGVPFVLMQEGIRFAMPIGDTYGTGGVAVICAWGDGSRDLFVERGVRSDAIAVTGSPRHDALDPAAWSDRGRAALADLGLATRPLVVMTNPIENQGYGSAADKLALFERFVREAEPVLRARGLAVVVKNHAAEDPAAYARVARGSVASDVVRVDTSTPLFAMLAVAGAAVVMTSTAGIEAMMFGVPVGVLELPGGGFGFEYVEREAAVGLRGGTIAAGLVELLDGGDGNARRDAAERLVERHLAHRGRATANVADAIARLV
jgi:hypothetical protein